MAAYHGVGQAFIVLGASWLLIRLYGRPLVCVSLTYPPNHPERHPRPTGGVQIVTGCNFVYFSAVEFFAGTGELTVLAGTKSEVA